MTDNSSNEDDKVGYRRPPRHSQFKPGESGNPKGRRKGSRNLRTDVRRALRKPVTFVENGKRKKASTQEAAILKLRERALKGDRWALDMLLTDLAARYNDEPPPPAADQVLSADDEAIVAAFLAQNATGSGGEASSTGRDTEAESKDEEPVPEQNPDDNKPPD